MLPALVIDLEFGTTLPYVLDVPDNVWSGPVICVGKSIVARVDFVGDVSIGVLAGVLAGVISGVAPGAAVDVLTDVSVKLLATVMTAFESESSEESFSFC